VSVLMPVKDLELKPVEECTSTFFSSREALGNFVRKESLKEPISSLVEIFLLSDTRIISATLSRRRNEAEMSIIETVRIRIANSFNILIVSFMQLIKVSVSQLLNRGTKLIHLNK
jgi:hypothetical protein